MDPCPPVLTNPCASLGTPTKSRYDDDITAKDPHPMGRVLKASLCVTVHQSSRIFCHPDLKKSVTLLAHISVGGGCQVHELNMFLDQARDPRTQRALSVVGVLRTKVVCAPSPIGHKSVLAEGDRMKCRIM